MSWIQRDEWVALVLWAMDHAAVTGPVNAVAPRPVTNAAFSRALGDALGRPVWLPAPAFALRLLLGEMGEALVLSGQRVLPERAQALGFRFRFEAVEEALRAILAPKP
jgi:NAD dependent epimerase/dehydratase family enzyme